MSLIGVYILIIIGIALFIARRWIGDESDFMIAGREMGVTLTAASLLAILLSGGFVPTLVLFGFIAGIGGAWFFWAWSLALGLVLVTWLGFWRYTGAYTPAEYFEFQHGVSGRLSVLFAILVFGLIAGAFQYLGAGSIIAGALGIDVATAIIGVGVAITLYALLAGIWGISITDLIQAVWVIVSVFVLLPIYLWSQYGLPTAGENIPAQLLSFPFGGMNVLSLAGGTVLTFIVLQYMLANAAHYWTRSTSARHDRAARIGWLVAIVGAVVLGLIGAVLGLWARTLIPDANPSLAFGRMVGEFTPVWLGALAISGIIAATMSTADMMYQIVANTITRDYYQRFTGVSDRDQLLRVARIAILIAGVITIGIAVVWPQGLPALIAFAFTMGAPLFVLSLDAWVFRYGTKEGTVLMVAAAFLVALYWVVVSPPIAAEVSVIWPAAIVSPIVYYVVSGVVRVTGSWWSEPASLTEIELVRPLEDD